MHGSLEVSGLGFGFRVIRVWGLGLLGFFEVLGLLEF